MMSSYDEGLISLDELRSVLSTFAGPPEPVHTAKEHTPRTQRRLALVATVLTAASVIVGSAVAATNWLTGSPAPSTVQSDFGSYPGQLGFTPEPGSAVLVASADANELYATTNAASSYCVVLTTAASAAPLSMGGGDCVPTTTADQPIVAGTFPVSSDTLALAGRVSTPGAASVQVQLPSGAPLKVPIGSSGFFLATFDSAPCQGGDWSPQFVALNASGNPVATSTITVEKTLTSAPSGCWLGSLTSEKAPSVDIAP